MGVKRTVSNVIFRIFPLYFELISEWKIIVAVKLKIWIPYNALFRFDWFQREKFIWKKKSNCFWLIGSFYSSVYNLKHIWLLLSVEVGVHVPRNIHAHLWLILHDLCHKQWNIGKHLMRTFQIAWNYLLYKTIFVTTKTWQFFLTFGLLRK